MGTARAPVSASGRCPAWRARVANPKARSGVEAIGFKVTERSGENNSAALPRASSGLPVFRETLAVQEIDQPADGPLIRDEIRHSDEQRRHIAKNGFVAAGAPTPQKHPPDG